MVCIHLKPFLISYLCHLRNLRFCNFQPIYAALFHVCSSEKDNYHVHCPTGVDSWCTYHLDIANKTKLHKPTKGLPEEAVKHLKPIFESLSDEDKSFNGLIWRRTPKDRFVKMASFELAMYDAAAHFNIGNLSSLLVYDNINIEGGYYTILGCFVDNNRRIKNAQRVVIVIVIVPKLINGTSVERKKAKVIKQKHQRVKFTVLVTFKDVCIYIYI